jgi:hypothetical protein
VIAVLRKRELVDGRRRREIGISGGGLLRRPRPTQGCSAEENITHIQDRIIQNDQKVSVHMMVTVQKTRKNMYSNNPDTIDGLKMALTEYIRNVDRSILNTVFENTVRRVNKCLETGGGHFEHYL